MKKFTCRECDKSVEGKHFPFCNKCVEPKPERTSGSISDRRAARNLSKLVKIVGDFDE